MNPYPPPTNSQTFSTKPLSPAPSPTQVSAPQTGGGSPLGDFGPLPPPGTPQLPGSLTGGMPPAMQAFYAQMRQRPTITDQNIDQSVRNSAIGDGFSGRRDGFLYAGGQRLMPITGSDAEDQATLRQFGVRPGSFGSEYGFGAPAAAPAAPPGAPMPIQDNFAPPSGAGGNPLIQNMRGDMNAMGGWGRPDAQTFGTTKPMGVDGYFDDRAPTGAPGPSPFGSWSGMGNTISNAGIQNPLPTPTDYGSLAPSTQAFMRAPSPMSSPWMPAGGASLPPLDTGRSPFGGGRNSVIEALMRQFRGRR